MSFLQPITHRFPTWISDPLVSLIGQECYTTLVWNTDFGATDCVKLSISKVLGLAIVAGGSIVKVPQILKIVGAKSARGLSLSSYVLDTAALAITVAYNFRNGFPWSTYGESVFLLVQNVIITFLIITFSNANGKSLLLFAFTAVSVLSTFALTSPSLPESTLQILAASCIPLSLGSKIPQIVANFRNGSTGQLSAFLVFNSLAGCLARVYTTATETKDPVLWWGFFLGAALNGVLAAQMALYWNSTTSSGKKLEKIGEVKHGKRGEEKSVAELKRAVELPTEAPSSPSIAAAKAQTSRPASPLSARKYVRKLD